MPVVLHHLPFLCTLVELLPAVAPCFNLVRLTGLEYEVLAHLAESPGKAWSFHELRCAARGPGPDYGGDSFAVRSLVQRLRRKLALAGVSSRIESVRGYGFRFEP